MNKIIVLASLFLLILSACETAFSPQQNITLPDSIMIEEPSLPAVETPAKEEPIVGLASKKCSDTDGGVNTYVLGTATEGALKNTDSCEGLSAVNEYSCADGHMHHQIISCGLNKGCTNGECIQLTQTKAFNDCIPGTNRCDMTDALYLDTCVDGSWKRGGRCPAGCSNNECVTQNCYSAGTRCNYDGTAVETCNVATGIFKFEKTCRFGCMNGECK